MTEGPKLDEEKMHTGTKEEEKKAAGTRVPSVADRAGTRVQGGCRCIRRVHSETEVISL
jgi:hypothetical protein